MQDSVSVNGTAFPIVEELDSFGRSIGYVLKRNGTAEQTVSYGYDSLGRLNTASFLHGGVAKQFSFERLAGTELMQNIVCPNGITKTYGYEANRDLITSINDKRGATNVVLRSYAYDVLGRPTARTYARQGTTRNDTFTHNDRSELTAATMGNDSFYYDYDNVGNRKVSTEKGETTVYDSNELNQYTAENEFVPQFDADGNQTLVKTGTGIWEVTYNALNRPTCFTRTNADDSVTTVTAAYDYMGRRVFKMVKESGVTTLHQRYIYRGYLQIAAHDLTRSTLNALWFITWDPTKPVATRPLAIQKDGTWYTYGLDLTKNVMEVYGTTGYIATAYTYSPFGEVTVTGSIEQPIQWSSEFCDDTELDIAYYNYRYYNGSNGKWIERDKIDDGYAFVRNLPIKGIDILGLAPEDEYPEEYFFYGTCNFFPNKEFAAGWHYQYKELKKAVDEANQIKDRQNRNCYEITIFTTPLSYSANLKLPFDGYDEAILITHSIRGKTGSYVLVNHTITNEKTREEIPEPYIPLSYFDQKKVKIYGCHLSEKLYGRIQTDEIFRRVTEDIKKLTRKECCEKTLKIQIVNNTQRDTHKFEGDKVAADAYERAKMLLDALSTKDEKILP